MRKEDFNTIYIISLMVLGLIFMMASNYENQTLFYIGLGLLCTGLTIGLFEAIRNDWKTKKTETLNPQAREKNLITYPEGWSEMSKGNQIRWEIKNIDRRIQNCKGEIKVLENKKEWWEKRL